MFLKRNYYIPLVLLAVGAVLRLLYLKEYSASPLFYMPIGPDIQEYDLWARKIFAGQLFWNEVPIHAPFYPLVLAGLFRFFTVDYFNIRFVQLMIGLLASVPLYIYLIGRKDAHPLKSMVPEIFLFFSCVYPPLIFYEGEIISEALLIPLLTICIYFLYRAEEKEGFMKKAFFSASGLCAGLAVITHPATIFFVIAETAYLAFRGRFKKNIAKLLFFGIAAALPIVPVSLYNSLLAARPVFVQANSGFNLFLGNNPDSTGSCYIRPGPEWDKVHNKADEVSKTEGITQDACFMRESTSFFKEHPIKAALNLVKKSVMTWNFREFCAGADMDYFRYFTPFQKMGRFAFAILGIAAFAGILVAISRRETLFEYRHFLMLAFSFWFVQTLFVTSGRYRSPMLPALFVLAAFFIAYVISEKKTVSNVVKLLLPAALSALVVFFPARGVSDPRKEHAEAMNILAEAAIKRGDYEGAEKYIQESMPFYYDWSRTFNLLGNTLYARKRPQEALVMYLHAEKLDPEDYNAAMNIGIMYSEFGDYNTSMRYFKKAFDKESKSAELYYNYGVMLMRAGRLDDAIQAFSVALKIDPSHKMALNNAAIALFTKGEPAKAVKYFRQSLSLDPANASLMVNLAAALYSTGNKFEADSWKDKALKLDPANPNARKLDEMSRGK